MSVNNLFWQRIRDLSKNETLEKEDFRTRHWKMKLSIIVNYKQTTLKFENEASQIQELENEIRARSCSACCKLFAMYINLFYCFLHVKQWKHSLNEILTILMQLGIKTIKI